ncbi:Type IV secretion system VirB2 protein [Rickettsiales endosymbiont of Paramecium tredecaurelia]|uniref:TrbC/VirB2 family protein n=1 Tax=Candidatus Sarmatiella mevalonica TaxID=2770581 RepID=UPI001922B2BA|nr:TrbC/VirB2 family protein [Candidatus Sarmatiella mevalonica]MBL3285043.1 Type IV secretion system VirB2 protein [Candidatus Sarmatiella mevalonica]
MKNSTELSINLSVNNLARWIFYLFAFYMLIYNIDALAGTTPDAATAKSDKEISAVFCHLYDMIGGDIGKALAAMAIICVAILFTMGKIQKELMFAVAVGIVFMFYAKSIVGMIAGDSAADFCKVAAQ